jgi:hypothetical protein
MQMIMTETVFIPNQPTPVLLQRESPTDVPQAWPRSSAQAALLPGTCLDDPDDAW